MYGLEGVLAVLGVVSGGDVQHLATDMGSDYLLVTVFLLDAAEELLEAVAQGGTFGKPQGQSGADVGAEGEQLEFFAYFAVVALLGFFEQYEILVQHFFLGEGYAVYTSQLVALFVTAPVCAG